MFRGSHIVATDAAPPPPSQFIVGIRDVRNLTLLCDVRCTSFSGDEHRVRTRDLTARFIHARLRLNDERRYLAAEGKFVLCLPQSRNMLKGPKLSRAPYKLED